MARILDVFIWSICLAAAYVGCVLAYNIWLHPLSKYPGPFLWRASRLPFLASFMQGRLPHDIKKLHEQYGDIVRLAPDELSFIDPAAWRDIYPKNFVRPYEYKDQPPGKTASNLIACTEEEHARFRRILAPAFSERYTAAQEPFVRSYVDKLVLKLNERIDESSSRGLADIDAVEWINYVAFDIIGDLVWGSSFGCLDGLTTHPWIQTVSQFKAATVVVSAKFYPWIYAILMAITPPSALNGVMEMWRITEQKVRERIAAGSNRPDIIGQLLESEKDPMSESMNREEMEVNAMMLVAAGSESVTTVLTGLLNYLLRNPDDLAAVTGEIRTAFSSGDEIAGPKLKQLPILNATLNEGMRLCPTIPDAMRRKVPSGGGAVAGEVLPADTVVSVPPWATYRAKRNFVEPERFMPARWLSNEKSGMRDDKAAFNPFSLGPHNCPGQNLAWLELRLILAKLLWTFDVSVSPGIDLPVWEEQGIWWFWDKQPTIIRLTRRS
ncbi:hypothetical protein VM1G_02942 [Cytospora mali]|uniref:Isotrichodermin C-15 hydroxylase n=1 Tax=Cytospora mali TaxID=578113 RepID=A0A194VSP4_CYTMA|nr:hypothetical protein VM1G_02942 [Valsa mali]